MDIGLIGLPLSGKTTIFNLLTHSHAETSAFGGKAESRRGLAPVPDPRLDWLSQLYHPRKVTPAQLQVVDVPGLARGESQGPNRFLNDVRLVDALIHVVRGFASELGEAPKPFQDIEDMELELGLSDLDLVEKRRQRIQSGKKVTPEQRHEMELLDRLHEALEAGERLDSLDLNDEDRRLISGYQFLTLKPMIWLLNLDDETFKSGQYPDRDQIEEAAHAKHIPVVLMAGAMEQEIQDLDAEDREEFMRDLGIEETGTARLSRATYDHLGLISFLTAGEDEVRAWTITRGTLAKEAAGKIHSDIERGFIRAEVVAFEALKAAGNIARAREQGAVRLEGKDYAMQDGDIVNFRFNV
ncbi:redox-regulated ATPase YchF [Sulfobacillus harzensis]|uniref:Redox-regulated ATPase YchF n=1 Tax=Sulfobacillus harzensis TaxID=2729629 RepID=A0A7Y0Q1I0_9FIRM|nr:redox-regulated ATPase YchF [Sulfobacillus harzensis]NMP22113.1 redox-regulated ATPase YchF [Sulfobacillus harzensis]